MLILVLLTYFCRLIACYLQGQAIARTQWNSQSFTEAVSVFNTILKQSVTFIYFLPR